MPLAGLLANFHSLPPLPTNKLGPSGADSQVGGFVYVLGHCASLQQTLLWGWEFLPLPQPLQVFRVRVFEAVFPSTGTLGCVVCLTPQFFLLVYPHKCETAQSSSHPLAVCPLCPGWPSLPILPVWMNVSSWTPWFPYSLIFWQFWLFLIFKFIVVLLLVVQRGKVYLPTPPSWPEVSYVFFCEVSIQVFCWL